MKEDQKEQPPKEISSADAKLNFLKILGGRINKFMNKNKEVD
jgi:hypothetical protein